MTAAFCCAGTVIYVANADSRNISVFSLDEVSGHVIPLQTVPVDGKVMPMALSPDKTLLYAATRSIPYQIFVFDIDSTSGRLSHRGTAALIDDMTNISIAPDGRYLFAASYAGNKISLSLLDEQGIPKPAAHILSTGSKPHQITSDPTSKFIYLSLLGENQLAYYQIDSTVVMLKEKSPPAISLPAGSGPRHFVFSPDAAFIYLLNELSGDLYLLQRNSATGTAQVVEAYGLMPENKDVKPWAADIHLTPDGQFLYASERSSSTLSGFKINALNGRLTPIGRWTTERQPRGFNISPSGRFLVAVGQVSNQMTIYRINSDTGALVPVHRHVTGINPNWVEIITIPDNR